MGVAEIDADEVRVRELRLIERRAVEARTLFDLIEIDVVQVRAGQVGAREVRVRHVGERQRGALQARPPAQVRSAQVRSGEVVVVQLRPSQVAVAAVAGDDQDRLVVLDREERGVWQLGGRPRRVAVVERQEAAPVLDDVGRCAGQLTGLLVTPARAQHRSRERDPPVIVMRQDPGLGPAEIAASAHDVDGARTMKAVILLFTKTVFSVSGDERSHVRIAIRCGPRVDEPTGGPVPDPMRRPREKGSREKNRAPGELRPRPAAETAREYLERWGVREGPCMAEGGGNSLLERAQKPRSSGGAVWKLTGRRWFAVPDVVDGDVEAIARLQPPRVDVA